MGHGMQVKEPEPQSAAEDWLFIFDVYVHANIIAYRKHLANMCQNVVLHT